MDPLKELLALLSVGVVLLDARGAVLHANPVAREIAGAGRGLELGAGGVAAIRPEERVSLAALLREALAAPAGAPSGGTLAVGAHAGRAPLRVSVTALGAGAEGTSDEEARPAVALLLADPERPPGEAPSVLQGLFGLTERQARLVLALAGGASVTQAAAALGISVSTARTYLKDTFRRTRTRRQAQLVSLVLRAVGAFRGTR
jgi:DNA-binding CsgD family transcriptional regulator